MKILLTLDYELFLGSKSGTVDNCLVTPMRHLHESVKEVGGVFTIFVDATYLYRVHELSAGCPELARQYDRLTAHLQELADMGHDLQLHIHPHWAFSTYNNGEWQLDHDHYKLCDLEPHQAVEIVSQSKELLDNIIGKPTVAFRAGGFSAQPTRMLTDLFAAHGLVADSSVCPGSVYDSAQQRYDYSTAPSKDCYRFSDDICVETTDGSFLEYPISMIGVSPVFHWKLVFMKLFKKPCHCGYGDGIPVKPTRDSIVARLTSRQHCHATIDGYKISFLAKAYRQRRAAGHQLLTVLGHPKLATPYSVQKLREFSNQVALSGDTFTTISQLIDESKA